MRSPRLYGFPQITRDNTMYPYWYDFHTVNRVGPITEVSQPKKESMKAAVFHKMGDIRVDTVEDPAIEQDDDVIVRITSTAICGSDLHIYDGFIPQVRDMILGHEFMGVAEEAGRGVTRLKKGDRVVVPFTIACGQCFYCSQGFHPSCEHTNPEKYGPRGDLSRKKAAACSATPTCTVDTAAARRSMSAYPKPMRVRRLSPTDLPTSRCFS